MRIILGKISDQRHSLDIVHADGRRGLREYATQLGQTTPGWLTEELVVAVQERMRQLLGRWKATPYRGVMELDWT